MSKSIIRILFAIDSLRAGGKERRMISLVKHLSNSKDFHCELLIFNKDVHYKEVFDINIKLNFLIRKNTTDFNAFKKFYIITKNFRPDIIHTWDTLTTLHAIPTAKLLRIKLITSKITDTPINYRKFTSFGIISELCFRFSNLILANSHAGIDAYGVSKKKSKVIYNGFDFSRIKDMVPKDEVKANFGITEGFLVGMVASFSENKDFSTFLEAAKQVRKKYNNIGFICTGDGVLLEKLKNEYSGSGIYFTGRLNDVESLMNICDIGVLITNSYAHGEGISNSLLEFMALGKPVIASNNGGNKELINNGNTGTILLENNHEILSDNVIDHFNKKGYYRNIGINAKERVIKYFSIETMVSEFKNVYQNSFK